MTVLGIDLGTTYSKCAFVSPASGKVVAVALSAAPGVLVRPEELERKAGLRSTVALGRHRDRRVARVGENVGGPGYTVIEESKGWIGEAKNPLSEDSPPWEVPDHAWSYEPEDIGAIVLRRVVDVARERHPEVQFAHAAITYPQRFESIRRAATRRAAEIAGLDVIGSITEPDAAAVEAALDASPGKYLFFDNGGGTLDVTVAELTGTGERTLRVLGVAGIHLGGRVFDDAVRDILLERYTERVPGFEPSFIAQSPSMKMAWMHLAEDVKVRLCGAMTGLSPAERDRAWAGTDLLFRDEQVFLGPQLSDVRIDAVSFRSHILPHVTRSIEACDEALARAGLAWADLHGVILVGGSSRNPLFAEALSSRVAADRVVLSSRPTTAIARGAAIYGAQLASGERPRVQLVSAVPRDFRVKAHDLARGIDVARVLVRKGTSTPYRIEVNVRATRGGRLPIELLEGDDESIDNCRTAGVCVIDGLPESAKAGDPVRLEVQISHGGQWEVAATHVPSNLSAKAALQFDPDAIVPTADVRRRREHIASLLVTG